MIFDCNGKPISKYIPKIGDIIVLQSTMIAGFESFVDQIGYIRYVRNLNIEIFYPSSQKSYPFAKNILDEKKIRYSWIVYSYDDQ